MKVAIFLCLFLAGSAFAADEALTADLEDFVRLLDMDKILAIVEVYMEDPEFVAIVEFMESEEIGEILLKFEQIPEYLELIEYLDASGLDVFRFLDLIHDSLGLPPIERPEPVKKIHVKGVMHDIIDDIREVLPKDEIRALHEEKLETSTAFKYYVERLMDEALMEIFIKLLASADFIEQIQYLDSKGLDLESNALFAAELFGFDFYNPE